MATRRIADEPAFVLHRYDWSESSLILEVFTRHHGRIALIAKGVDVNKLDELYFNLKTDKISFKDYFNSSNITVNEILNFEY